MNFEQHGSCDQKMSLLKYFKLYMIYFYSRTGSLEIGDNAVDFDEDEDESHWNEANMSFLF